MADLAPVVGDVFATTVDSILEMIVVGESVVDGDLLYFDATEDEWMKCDCTNSAKIDVERIATSSGGNGEAIQAALPGSLLNLGVAVAKGKLYVMSVNGKIAPVDDVTTGDIVCVVGIGETTTELRFEPWITEVVSA